MGTALAKSRRSPSRRLRLQIYSDPTEIADAWQAFEKTAFATVFQSYAWVASWCHAAARATGEDPILAVWYDEDQTIALIWPMAISTRHTSRVLTWLGQGYTNYNAGLYRRDLVDDIDAVWLRQLVDDLAAALPKVPAMHLIDQPCVWNGQQNPLTRLPHQPSANVSFEMPLCANPADVYKSALSSDTRRRLERLDRRLREEHVVEFGIADAQAERLAVFSTFMSQKAAQFEQLGVANVFAATPVTNFYRELFTQRYGGAFEAGYLKVDGEIVATSNGIKFQDRFYHLTLSMAQDGDDKLSPGRLLSREHIGQQCRDGISMFDFGPGSGRHKLAWHPASLAYFETYLPLRSTATLSTALTGAVARCRAAALQSPVMQSAFRRLKESKRRLKNRTGR